MDGRVVLVVEVVGSEVPPGWDANMEALVRRELELQLGASRVRVARFNGECGLLRLERLMRSCTAARVRLRIHRSPTCLGRVRFLSVSRAARFFDVDQGP